MRWIPCTEQLPDADRSVLVTNPASAEPVWLGYLDGDQWFYIDGTRACGVTAWMDLPDPYTE